MKLPAPALRSLALWILALLALPGAANTQQGPPPEVRRAIDGLVRMLDGTGEASVRRYAAEAFSADFLRTVSADELVERLAFYREAASGRTDGIQVQRTPDGLLVVLGNGAVAFALALDEEGKLTSLELADDSSSPGDPPAPTDVDLALGDDWTSLQQLMERALAASGAPGAAVAVVRGGTVVDSAVAGVRMAGRGDPIRAGDRFHWGSLGKSVTGTVLGALFEQGVLAPTTTLGEALPDVLMLDAYRSVTLAQLMRHEAGLPPYTLFEGETIDRFRAYQGTAVQKRAAFVADVLTEAPVARPGTRFNYSNAGVSVAGHVAEVAAGRPWEELVREHVFGPAGMTEATFGFPATPEHPDQPRGHMAMRPGPLEVMAIGDFGDLDPMLAPAGGISSSIGDLARYAAYHLDGLEGRQRHMSAATFAELHAVDPESQLIRNGTARYTWGWEVTDWPVPGVEAQWHNGSGGAFYAEIRLFPKEDLAIVVMSNAGGPIAFSGDQIVEAVYRRYGATPVVGVDPAQPDWDHLPEYFHRAAMDGLSGAVMARRGGRELLRQAFGLADRSTSRLMTTETVFGLGSTPIDFTVTAALILAQRGVLDLDRPVSDVFPGLPQDKAALTPAMVLLGRSGLVDFIHTADDWDPDLAWVDRDTAVRRILASPAIFPPGTASAHSHAAYVLLAAMVEELSGVPYRDFLRQEILEPLGMERTGFYGESLEMEPGDFATGYGGQSVGVPNIPPNWGPTSWLIMGSGGMFSTLEDMAVYYDAENQHTLVRPEWRKRAPRGLLGVAGSDRGFYLFHFDDNAGTELLFLTNREGPRQGTPALQKALMRLVGVESGG